MKLPLAVALMTFPSVSSAQTVTALLEVDQLVPGTGRVASFREFAVNDSGEWVVCADMTPPMTSGGFGDFALIGPSGPILMAGQPVQGAGGLPADFFQQLAITGDGDVVCTGDLVSGPLDQRKVLIVNDTAVRRSEGAVDAQGVPSTGVWRSGLNDVRVAASGSCIVTGNIAAMGLGSGDRSVVRYDIEDGQVASGELLLAEGDVLPGQTMGVISVRSLAHNDAGQSLLGVVVSGSGTPSSLYLDDELLATEGGVAPLPGRVWDGTLSGAPASINSRGTWAFASRLFAFNPTEWILVRDGELFRAPGDTLPDIAPFTMDRWTTSSVSVVPDRPQVLEDGRVAWTATWNDPDTTVNSGLFIEDRLVLQAGQALSGNRFMSGIFADTWRVSPNGRFVIFETFIREGSSSFERVVALADLSQGSLVCSPAAMHSGGVSAAITAVASSLVPGEPLQITAYRLPVDRMGYFLGSMTQDFVPGAGGGQGNLCLGGSIGRFIGQAMGTGPGGTLILEVDTQAIPVTPNQAVLAGEAWTFQAWFRDQNPTATSNFSSAIEVTFE